MIISSIYYLVTFLFHTQCIYKSYLLTCTQMCVYVCMHLYSWVSTFVNLFIDIANRKKYIDNFGQMEHMLLLIKLKI